MGVLYRECGCVQLTLTPRCHCWILLRQSKLLSKIGQLYHSNIANSPRNLELEPEALGKDCGGADIKFVEPDEAVASIISIASRRASSIGSISSKRSGVDL